MPPRRQSGCYHIDHDDPMKQYDEAGLNAPQIVDAVLKALKHNSAGVETGEEVRA